MSAMGNLTSSYLHREYYYSRSDDWDFHNRDNLDSGHKKLMAAILLDAMSLIFGAPLRPCEEESIRRYARIWLFSSEDEPFSFKRIIQLLSLEHYESLIKRKIREYTEGAFEIVWPVYSGHNTSKYQCLSHFFSLSEHAPPFEELAREPSLASRQA